MPGSRHAAVGAPRRVGRARTALEAGPSRLLEGEASAGNGVEHLLGMGGAEEAGSRHLSLFWL